MLLCNPFGQEAIRCHRLLRVMADRLSRDGYHVLRFDYFGTGDSDGGDFQGDLLAWVDDVLSANEEVVRRSSYPRVSWFGLRLGATLAALASARSPTAPERVVLWDPVVEGQAYLAELEKAHCATLMVMDAWTRSTTRDGEHGGLPSVASTEVLGFPLTTSLRQQIRNLSANSWIACRARRVSLVGASDSPDIATIEKLLAQAGTSYDTRRVDTGIDWASTEAMNTAIVPAEAIQVIVAALSETA